ncbi:MAG: DNA mismatch repair protein MutS [bacterium]
MESSSLLTPAMRQYMQAKAETPADAILLFRMGDFYEIFFEDARRAAPLLEVVLTQRNQVPMCGVPYHALNGYVSRLLEAGVKVAIAEQMEDPKLAKGLVKRAVTRVITPGTVLDDAGLPAGRGNFLAALIPAKDGGRCGLALLEVSTGDFRATELATRASLETELNRATPAECLLPQSVRDEWEQRHAFPEAPPRLVWTGLDDWVFDGEAATDRLCRHFGVLTLDGFGCRDLPLAVQAAGAVLHYVQSNLRRDAAQVTRLQIYRAEEFLVLDRVSQRNLELVEPIVTDARNATLLSVLQVTVTPMGGRLLRDWLLRPLCQVNAINHRLDGVEALVRDPLLRSELRETLAAVRDLERTLTRLCLGANANARDLAALQAGLAAVPGLRALVAGLDLELVNQLRDSLHDLPELGQRIRAAIVDEPPLAVKDGGLIRDGHHAQLDELRRASSEGKNWIAALQAREQERTGIKSLKVRYNQVFGYYLELSKTNQHLAPADYIRKQTLVNAERFITPELKEIEDKILGAEEKSKALEYELFQELRVAVAAETARIQETARAIAVLDVLAALAETAAHDHYCRPVLSDEPVLDLRDARHPVLDHWQRDQPFVPNDTFLDTHDHQLLIITGPNMAGKSTYIRQVALLVILAQMGSFVPASAATVGVADRIFTRVGAADDLSRGQSTFMVEMVETANILNNATPRSLVILDEVGRGTSTFDGLSLAWAIAEHLHDTPTCKPRTLFATHYHELTELALTRPGVKNYNVAVREWEDKVIFLRKIIPGGADKSYGIQVARLAGLPKSVVERAREVLDNLEGNALAESGQPRLARHRRVTASGKPVPEPPPPQPMLFDWN